MTFHPPWFNPKMPARERCVLAPLLESAYAECPEKVFAVFDDGSQWTYADLYNKSRARAAALKKLGVSKGDRVVVWLPNGADAVLTWFAVNLLGGCFVPINTAYRGSLLSHVIRNSNARLMVAHIGLLSRLQEIELAPLERVIAIGDDPVVTIPGIKVDDESVLLSGDNGLVNAADAMPWDTYAICYTSGTTGPSKGVLCSYFHAYTVAEVIHGHMGEDDRILVNGPIFHIGGTGAVYAALIHRASIALVKEFKPSNFWRQMRETRSTLTAGLLGSIAPFLAKTAAPEDEVHNSLRRTHFYPLSDVTIEFANRFDFEFFSGFGMTELPFVLMTDVNATIRGSCGRPRSGIEARLVDSNDCEVSAGEVGELIVRTDNTWSFMSGYNAMPEATNRMIRNGWFHTGDLFRRDEQGNYYFVDRAKDVIRRRGENISSQEVESVVFKYPAVRDVAAIGVASEFGEDDVMIIIEPRDDKNIEPEILLSFLTDKMAHFMLPRYIRIVSEMEKTPTGKIRKETLREQGVTPDTWDREKFGIAVRNEKLD